MSLRCPFCKEDVTESPEEDCFVGEAELECESCHEAVIVTTTCRMKYVTRRKDADD